jgi:hypothetical protein
MTNALREIARAALAAKPTMRITTEEPEPPEPPSAA